MNELNSAMNLKLKAANKKLYNAMMYGVSVTEFVDSHRKLEEATREDERELQALEQLQQRLQQQKKEQR